MSRRDPNLGRARARLGYAWVMGLVAAIGAAALLAAQLVFAPPWRGAPPLAETYPVLHGPNPSELFAALTGRERQATIDELKSLRESLDGQPDPRIVLPALRDRLAALEGKEEAKRQQEINPALVLAALVGRIDGAIGAIERAAARVNADPPPATVAPLSLGVAGLGLLASMLGLLGGAFARPGALPAPDFERASQPDTPATLRALLDEAWAELGRQREAGARALADQAAMGARLSGAVLDASERLEEGIAKTETARAEDSVAGGADAAAVTRRLEALAEQLGDAMTVLPSLAAMLAETAEALRGEGADTAGEAAERGRLDALCDRLAMEARHFAEACEQMSRVQGMSIAQAQAAIEAHEAAVADRLEAASRDLGVTLAALPARAASIGAPMVEALAGLPGLVAIAARTGVGEAALSASETMLAAVARLETVASASQRAGSPDPALTALPEHIEGLLLAREADETSGREAARAALLDAVAREAEATRAALAEAIASLSERVEAAVASRVAASDAASDGAWDAEDMRATALQAAAERLIRAAESQAERLEAMVRDIVGVAGALPAVGGGLVETAASLGIAAREQGATVAEAGRQLAEAARRLEEAASAGAQSSEAVAAAVAEVACSIASRPEDFGVPADDLAFSPALRGTLAEIASIEARAGRLAATAAALRASPERLPETWLAATPALLSGLDLSIQRLRGAATALALAGDASLARDAA